MIYGLISKLVDYAKSFDIMNKKNVRSLTPQSCNLKFFIFVLNDSDEALRLAFGYSDCKFFYIGIF
ncbi:hypothetical protein DBR39_01710 [Chryseobacterium sp. KBW03]|nr:hypothetical protein DBR39_01710 [Chryseobacterium sp. KBW03]